MIKKVIKQYIYFYKMIIIININKKLNIYVYKTCARSLINFTSC